MKATVRVCEKSQAFSMAFKIGILFFYWFGIPILIQLRILYTSYVPIILCAILISV
jgi:hypothetical protein